MDEEKVTASLMKDEAKVHADGMVKKAPMSTKVKEEGARTNRDDAAAVGGEERRKESDTLHSFFQ